MKRGFSLAVTASLLLAALPAQAQFGSLLKDLNKKVQEVEKSLGGNNQATQPAPAPTPAGAPAAAAPVAAKGEPAKTTGHCKAGEQTLFSCSLGAKVVSFCATPGSGVAQSIEYRYGALGNVELAESANAGKPFRATEQAWDPRTTAGGVYFAKGDVTYGVTACGGACEDNRSALVVFKNQKPLAKSFCIANEEVNWPVDFNGGKSATPAISMGVDKAEPDFTEVLFGKQAIKPLDKTMEVDRIKDANFREVFSKLAANNMQNRQFNVPIKLSVASDTAFKGNFLVSQKLSPKNYAYVRLECKGHSSYNPKVKKNFTLYGDSWSFNDGDENAEVQVLTVVIDQCTLLAP